MPETVNFNVRMIPARTAKRLMTLAKKAGMRREHYIRRMFELHVELADQANQTPGRYVLETPSPEQVAAAEA